MVHAAPWSFVMPETNRPTYTLPTFYSVSLRNAIAVSSCIALLGSGNASPDDTRQLLLADTEEHADAEGQDSDHDNREAGKQPELDTDVLL